MSRYIDTHCHLDQILERMGLDGFAALRAEHLGPDFEACLSISCDPDSVEPVLALLENEGVYAAFGIHPHDAKHYTPALESKIAAALKHPKCLAYGEIGLDYHYDLSERALQRENFVHQLRLGLAAGKPLIIHTREAEDDTLEILRAQVPRDWPIHVHCFTSSLRLAQALLADFSNLYIGFTGIVTFKNSDDLRETARFVPVDRMLVETDGPYLAPVPHRGKPAHPGHIPLIVAKLAEIQEMTADALGARLLANAKRVYGFGKG
jgi:TatD DNase family protein